MRYFLRRFRRALRTVPRRMRWIVIATATVIGLFAVDGGLAILFFFAILGLLVIRKFRGTPNDEDPESSAQVNEWNPTTCSIMMNPLLDIEGHLCGDVVISSEHGDH
jgi:hypothetical protein